MCCSVVEVWFPGKRSPSLLRTSRHLLPDVDQSVVSSASHSPVEAVSADKSGRKPGLNYCCIKIEMINTNSFLRGGAGEGCWQGRMELRGAGCERPELGGRGGRGLTVTYFISPGPVPVVKSVRGGVLLSSFFECLRQCPWCGAPGPGWRGARGACPGKLWPAPPGHASAPGAPLLAGGGRGRVARGPAPPEGPHAGPAASRRCLAPSPAASRRCLAPSRLPLPPRRLPPGGAVSGGPRGSADGLAVLSAPKRSPLPAAPSETVLALAAWRVTLGLRSGSTRWIKETRPLYYSSLLLSPFPVWPVLFPPLALRSEAP